jgi:hypothetical protein
MSDEEETVEIVDQDTGEIVTENVPYATNVEEAAARHDFQALNEIVLKARNNEIKWKFIQLRALYEIYQDSLWATDKNYHTVNDWLGELYEQGIEYASTSTLYKKVWVIGSHMALGGTLNDAILTAVKFDGLIEKSVNAGIVEVSVVGEGRNAVYSGQITEKGKEILGDGGFKGLTDVVNRLPKGAANQYVNTAFGLSTIRITSLIPWTKAIPFDIKGAPTLIGEVTLEDTEGVTPYQFVVILEKDVNKRVIEGVGKRLKSNMKLIK